MNFGDPLKLHQYFRMCVEEGRHPHDYDILICFFTCEHFDTGVNGLGFKIRPIGRLANVLLGFWCGKTFRSLGISVGDLALELTLQVSVSLQ